MFSNDRAAIKKINEFEIKYSAEYNSLVAYTEEFYHKNKVLDVKSYALLAKATFEDAPHKFNVCMNLYRNKPVDYQATFAKLWDTLYKFEYI